MTLTVEPYVSVGPMRFGMSQREVVAAMGNPQRITQSRGGNTILWYGEANAILENDRLVEVGFGPRAEVSVCGIQPFVEPDAFAGLCRLDGNPCELLGFIVLWQLGITLTGFHDKDESQKALTAFTRGRWDVVKSQMKPFHIQPAGSEVSS